MFRHSFWFISNRSSTRCCVLKLWGTTSISREALCASSNLNLDQPCWLTDSPQHTAEVMLETWRAGQERLSYFSCFLWNACFWRATSIRRIVLERPCESVPLNPHKHWVISFHYKNRLGYTNLHKHGPVQDWLQPYERKQNNPPHILAHKTVSRNKWLF